MISHIPDQLTSEDAIVNADEASYKYDGRMVSIDVTCTYDSDGVRDIRKGDLPDFR